MKKPIYLVASVTLGALALVQVVMIPTPYLTILNWYVDRGLAVKMGEGLGFMFTFVGIAACVLGSVALGLAFYDRNTR